MQIPVAFWGDHPPIHAVSALAFVAAAKGSPVNRIGTLVTGAKTGQLCLWAVEGDTSQTQDEYTVSPRVLLTGNSSAVTALCACVHQWSVPAVLSAFEDGSMCVWDAADGLCLGTSLPSSVGGMAVTCMAALPGGRLVACGGRGTAVYIVDVLTMETSRALRGAPDYVVGLALIADPTPAAPEAPQLQLPHQQPPPAAYDPNALPSALMVAVLRDGGVVAWSTDEPPLGRAEASHAHGSRRASDAGDTHPSYFSRGSILPGALSLALGPNGRQVLLTSPDAAVVLAGHDLDVVAVARRPQLGSPWIGGCFVSQRTLLFCSQDGSLDLFRYALGPFRPPQLLRCRAFTSRPSAPSVHSPLLRADAGPIHQSLSTPALDLQDRPPPAAPRSDPPHAEAPAAKGGSKGGRPGTPVLDFLERLGGRDPRTSPDGPPRSPERQSGRGAGGTDLLARFMGDSVGSRSRAGSADLAGAAEASSMKQSRSWYEGLRLSALGALGKGNRSGGGGSGGRGRGAWPAGAARGATFAPLGAGPSPVPPEADAEEEEELVAAATEEEDDEAADDGRSERFEGRATDALFLRRLSRSAAGAVARSAEPPSDLSLPGAAPPAPAAEAFVAARAGARPLALCAGAAGTVCVWSGLSAGGERCAAASIADGWALPAPDAAGDGPSPSPVPLPPKRRVTAAACAALEARGGGWPNSVPGPAGSHTLVLILGLETGAVLVIPQWPAPPASGTAGCEWRELKGHEGRVTCLLVVLSVGRPKLVSGDSLGEVRVWDLLQGTAVCRVARQVSPITLLLPPPVIGTKVLPGLNAGGPPQAAPPEHEAEGSESGPAAFFAGPRRPRASPPAGGAVPPAAASSSLLGSRPEAIWADCVAAADEDGTLLVVALQPTCVPRFVFPRRIDPVEADVLGIEDPDGDFRAGGYDADAARTAAAASAAYAQITSFRSDSFKSDDGEYTPPRPPPLPPSPPGGSSSNPVPELFPIGFARKQEAYSAGGVVRHFGGHSSRLVRLRWWVASDRLLAACRDGSIYVWQLATGALERRLPPHLAALSGLVQARDTSYGAEATAGRSGPGYDLSDAAVGQRGADPLVPVLTLNLPRFLDAVRPAPSAPEGVGAPLNAPAPPEPERTLAAAAVFAALHCWGVDPALDAELRPLLSPPAPRLPRSSSRPAASPPAAPPGPGAPPVALPLPSVGLRGAGGRLALVLPRAARRGGALRLSPHASAQLSSACLALARSLMAAAASGPAAGPDAPAAWSRLLAHYGTLRPHALAPKNAPLPSLPLLVASWVEPCGTPPSPPKPADGAAEEMQQAARALFEGTVARLAPEGRSLAARTWASRLPFLPELPMEVINDPSLPSVAPVFILALLGSQNPSLLPADVTAQVVGSLLALLERAGPKVRVMVADVMARGYPHWRPYIRDPASLLRLLFYHFSRAPAGPAGATGRVALTLVGTFEPALFLQTMGQEAARPHMAPEERAAALLSLAALVRKTPASIVPLLTSAVEAILRCLDPSVPDLRESCLKPATQVLHLLTSTFAQVSFSLKTQQLAVGTMEGPIVIYDLRTAARWRVLEGHSGPVTALALSPSGSTLGSFSAHDHTLRSWHTSRSLFSMLRVDCIRTYTLPRSPEFQPAAGALASITLQWTPSGKSLELRREAAVLGKFEMG